VEILRAGKLASERWVNLVVRMFRHNGIDRRLTDVHGHIIREISS
jgi:hypothetical protein